MQIEKLKIEQLIPADYNPRKDLKPGDPEYDKLKRSIEQFGYVEPLIWNKTTGRVVGGHQRLKVLIDMGVTEVDCVVVELPEDKEKALNIALNKISGEWDKDKLALLIADLQGADFDVSLTGFEPAELDDLFKEKVKDNIHDDEFDVDAALKEPVITKLGDVWTLGRHRLVCGDSTKAGTFELLMAGSKANLVVTDPPYNVNYEGSAGKIKNDNMANDAFYSFLLAAFQNTEAVMADDASIYVFHADTEGLNFRRAFSDAGFLLSGCCIWKKQSLVLGRSPYQWQHEPCQPAGTMVLTPQGYVPIEKLKDGDRVVSFDPYSGNVKGYREGLPITTANRDYCGNLYSVCSNGKTTQATNNHLFTVRFNAECSRKYCTYLMQRGNRFRVGHTIAYDARQFGLKTRMHMEKAEKGWLIASFDSATDAQLGEQYIACTFGIPYTHWEIDRGFTAKKSTQRTKTQVDIFYDKLDPAEQIQNARRLLEAYGRSYDYPLITVASSKDKFSRRTTVKVRACNLMPEIMQVPVAYGHYEGDETFTWENIESVRFSPYSGKVYSLDVAKYRHYIADGIVVHNCLFGWKKKGKHQWYTGRKETTIWEFDKPKKNGDHPTMKPIPLLAYPIMNSSMSNALVLDPFGGSGSTLIACEQSDRSCYTIELDEKFCDVIVKRYIEQVGSSDKVSVQRDGLSYSYAEVCADGQT